MSVPVTLTELWIYPIKSFPGLSVERLTFDSAGPVEDRRWMLVDEKGKFVSQRGLPALASFAMAKTTAGYTVTAPDGDSAVLPEQGEGGDSMAVTVWKDDLQAHETSPELSQWFSGKLGKTVHLVHTGPASERRISDPEAMDHELVGFADGYPLLVCNEASLDSLNDVTGRSLDMRRFRPNVVVRGAEDRSELLLGRLRLQSGHIELLKPCTRCNIPAIDPDTATYEKDVAAQLKTHCEWDGSTIFGVNGVARGLTEIKVGDKARLESNER